MLEVMKFIFSDFWHWLGTAVLLAIIASAFGGFIKIILPNVRNTTNVKKGE
jgi:hypothetical protein